MNNYIKNTMWYVVCSLSKDKKVTHDKRVAIHHRLCLLFSSLIKQLNLKDGFTIEQHDNAIIRIRTNNWTTNTADTETIRWNVYRYQVLLTKEEVKLQFIDGELSKLETTHYS